MAKSKIDVVRENLDKIREYKSLGMRDEDIYKQLGISRSAWYDYIKKNKDISEAVKGGTTELVFKLKGELVRQAFKHSLETKKQYIKVDMETGHKTQYTEITTKEIDGNVGAAHLLLKNLDKDNWKDSPAEYDLKKMEYELRKKIAEDKEYS